MKTPLAVIREALLQPSPCPTCGSERRCRCMPDLAARIDARANLVHVALVEHGLLATPEQAAGPTQEEIEEVAKFLARESRFIRYSDDDWQMLMTSAADVETAYAKAKKANEGGEKDVLEALGRGRRLLLGHIEARRAAEKEV